jgi:hypothetical protein
VPEQLKTTIVDGKLVTSTVEHTGWLVWIPSPYLFLLYIYWIYPNKQDDTDDDLFVRLTPVSLFG